MKKLLIPLVVLLVVMLSGCPEGTTYINYEKGSYTDTDQDGIPDVAELAGTSFYGMPLYDWGARPGIRDVFIHVAPMNYTGQDAGMILQKEALDRIVAAFAKEGFAVHFDVGRYGLYDEYESVSSGSYNLSDRDHRVPYAESISINYSNTAATVMGYKNSYFPSERINIFHFLVIGSSQNPDGSGGSSGVAELPGNDFLVTLANWNFFFGTGSIGSTDLTRANIKNWVVNNQAATIMHEFGHNLGLRHGGDENQNYKPNYYSIMNYLYQLAGLPKIGTNEGDRYYYERYLNSGSTAEERNSSVWAVKLTTKTPLDYEDNYFEDTFRMDYSHGNGSDLNEADLNENTGLGQTGSGAVDWNGSGGAAESSVVDYDINPTWTTQANSYNPPLEPSDAVTANPLEDHDDWTNLVLYYVSNTQGSSRFYMDDEQTIEAEESLLHMMPEVTRR